RGITAEALRMQRLVDDLLVLARLDGGARHETSAVDLTAVAREAVAAARVTDPDRALSVQAETAATVRGDAGQLRRVVDNLLANVRTHTPAGTAAVVVIGAEPFGDTGDTGARVVPGVTLAVADDGPGIPADALPHVLDRFYRGDPAHSGDGSGLGLSIVAAVARAHGGTVEVSGASGAGTGGTRVTLRLPAGR
ncbi:sensor histidine kinase, partial [Streptomyces sp. SID5785]|uniref:sensor histidine kinase n=1 Tax=Streptomyces sp. SID5785 TaxID=2690309 RepID=UPI001360BEA3